jgi:hypothetical protein
MFAKVYESATVKAMSKKATRPKSKTTTRRYYFPALGKVVEAGSLAEAEKLAKAKPAKEGDVKEETQDNAELSRT